MNKMKKFLAGLLALVMIISLVPMSALAADGYCDVHTDNDSNNVCDVCGYHTNDACTYGCKDHTIIHAYKAPTCSEPGQRLTVCCSHDSIKMYMTLNDNGGYAQVWSKPDATPIPATGHTDEDGNHVCDVCGKVTVRVCDHDSETLTVVQEYKAPTCGEEGKQMVVNCGPDGNYVVYPDGTFSAGASTVIPALDHETYTEVVTVTEADCVNPVCKVVVTKCRNCDYRKEGTPYTIGAGLGHDTYWEVETVSEATCVEPCVKVAVEKCRRCDEYRKEGTPYNFGDPLPHNSYWKVEIVSEADCVNPVRKVAVEKCYDCDYRNEGIPYNIGDPLGHTDDDGDHECDICGETASECVNDNAGEDHKCDICEKVIDDCVDEGNDYLCDICGACVIDICGYGCDDHEIKQYYQAPTCEEDGHYMVVHCGRVSTSTGSGDYVVHPDGKFAMLVSDDDAVIPALNHSETREDRMDPNCTKTGYVKTYCKFCDKLISEETLPTNDDHAFHNGKCLLCGKPEKCEHTEVRVDRMDPNCSKEGYVNTYCKECDELLSEEVLPTNDDHAFHNGKCLLCGACDHDYVVVREQAPNCVEYGYVWYECSRCGAEKNGEAGEPDPTAHDYVVVRELAPTCTEAGYVWYECSLCGAEKNHEVGEVDPTAHDYVVVKELAPTCTEAGYVWKECSLCGAEKNHEVGEVDPTAHDYVVVKELAPTCTEAGYVWKECSLCGAEKNHEVGEPDLNNHDMDEGEITTPATCVDKGVKTYTCKRGCGHTVTEDVEIDPENHTGKTVTKNESETYSGDIHCADCDALLEEGKVIAVPSTPITPAKPTWKNWLDKVINNWKDKIECPEEPTEPEETIPEETVPEETEPEETEPEETVPAAPVTPAKPNWGSIIRGCWNWIFR